MLKRLFLAFLLAVGTMPAEPFVVSDIALATTYTSCLGLSLPVPGDPSVANIWGTLLNTNFTMLDGAFGKTASISVAGGSNVVLTSSQGNPSQITNSNFVFTGTLTGNIYVLFPASGCGSFSVQNNTSGAFTLSVGANNGSSAPAGTTITVSQGGTADLVSDGTNVRRRVDVLGMGALAAANNLSDVASASSSRTNLGLGASAVENLSSSKAGAVTDDGAGNLYAAPPTLHSQVFTSSGTFTVPAKATAATVFEFDVVGGGGGGAGSQSSSTVGTQGGASGGAISASFSGFSASSSVSITVGTGGSGGSAPGGAGSTGNASSITYTSQIITANGGNPGVYLSNDAQSPAPGTTSASVGASGLTLVSSNGLGAQPGSGGSNNTQVAGGNGGGNGLGTGGAGSNSSSAALSGGAGTNGGGGGGGTKGGGGGAGGTGIVIVKWVL